MRDTEPGMPAAHAAAYRLLWDQPATPRRGPKPTLSLAVIAGTGIELADRAGLAAVTMQQVAAEVGVTKMALYRYVPGKTELVALMVDIGMGPAPDLAGNGWRGQLTGWAHALYAGFRRHPWALEATVGSRAIGPNEAGWMDRAVAVLAGTGLRGAEQLDVLATLSGHARTMAQQTAASADGGPEQTMAGGILAMLRDRAADFPALATAFDAAVHTGETDNALDFGLARILDGVELLIAARSGA